MNKFKVQFVKYDMTKTRNRNRKDMMVELKTEKSVRAQLEKIHKGEQVVTIHELIWDDSPIKQTNEEFFTGIVKFFEMEKGFGFIVPDDRDIEELFFHQSACADGVPRDREKVEFKISKGPKGNSAIAIRSIE